MVPSELSLSEVQVRTAMDGMGAYVYVKDMAGRYTYANELVCQLFKAPLDRIIGKDDGAFFNLQVTKQMQLNDKRVIELNETFSAEETNVLETSGETMTFWTVKSPIHNVRGEVVGLIGISSDITQSKKFEHELQEQRELMELVFEHVGAHVYMKTKDRRYLYVNRETANIFGLSPHEIQGKKDTDLLPKNLADQFWQMDKKVFDTGRKQSGPETFVDANGKTSHFWATKIPFKYQGLEDALIGFSTDITQLHELKEQLQLQAFTDVLTGVSNRRHFYHQAEKEFVKAKRNKKVLTVIAFDIDHFKAVNDSYGHQAGDAALQKVAHICQATCRSYDLFGRTGGEEFAVLMPDTDLEAATQLAERLRNAVSELQMQGNWPGFIQVTISLGVAIRTVDDRTLDAFLGRADNALYAAKNSGRNQVSVSDESAIFGHADCG
jgi:diguanylate cyclase (GGDEF)-like protein/PAS domain S-box-containing protein